MTGSSIPPIQPGAQRPQAPAQPVQIVSLPEGLQNNARALRLEGEVVGQNRDGSTRVKTAEGNIDILIKGRQPQSGQRIELEIPAGNQPRQASMRTLPSSPAPTQNTQTPPSSQPPAQATPQATQPAQPPQAPVQDSQSAAPRPAPQPSTPPPQSPVQGAPAPTPPPQPALPPLNPGQVIKLIPVPPDMITTGITDTVDAPVKLPQQPIIPQTGEKQPGQVTPLSKPTAQNLSTLITPQAGIDKAGTAILMQAAPKNFFTQIAQAVKTMLPLSGMAQPTPLSSPQGSAPLMPAQNAGIKFQELPPAPIFARITAITSLSGQTMFAPPTMDMPDITQAMPAAPMTEPVLKQTTLPPLPQAFTAPIIGHTPEGRAIIPLMMHADGKTAPFIIQTQATLPQGAQVTLMPQLQPQTSGAAPVTQAIPNIIPQSGIAPMQPVLIQTAAPIPAAWRPLIPLMQASSVWPVMDDIFQSFYQATPQAAQILGRIIPSPANPQSFGSAILLFAATLKSGDMQGWLGDKKTDMIQKLGRDQLLSRLSGESASLPQNADAAPMDWKSYPIPLLWHNEISKVLFHVRKEPSEDERENAEGGTRFVMDVSLTRMGNVQIDGMVRGNRLDLIVRTENAISLSMQDAMRSAYAKALDGTDVYGDIGFQSDAASWVHVLARGNAMAASA